MDMVSREDLVIALERLPTEEVGDWLMQLTRIVVATPEAEQFLEISRDGTANKQVRFAAFYGYAILVRRRKEYTQFREMVQRNGMQFSEHPMYLCLSAIAVQLGSDRTEDLRIALSKAEQALIRMPDNFVVKNQVAEYLANLAEVDATVSQAQRLRAVDLAREAAATSQYPRYYQTVALAEMATGSYAEARRAIAKAIDLEPSSSSDFAIRIGDYNIVRIKIDTAESMERIHVVQGRATDEMRSLRSDMIQLLGVLAAVIALLTLTGQLATRMEFRDAAPLIATSAGAVLTIFAGLNFLVGNSSRNKEKILALVLGLALLMLPSVIRATFS